MKKTVSVILSVLLIFSSIICFAKGNDTDISIYENNEIFVLYKNFSNEVIKVDGKEELKNKLSEFSNDDNVLVVQPNYVYEQSTNDSLYSKQWALLNDGTFKMEERQNEYPVYDDPFGSAKNPWEWLLPDWFGIPGGRFGKFAINSKIGNINALKGIDINIEKAWESYDGAKRETIIAVVDTGIDFSHEDLQGRIWVNSKETDGNGIDDDGNGYIDDVNGWNFYNDNKNIYTDKEDDSHGTHCAGTIGAIRNNNTGISGVVDDANVKIMSVKALGGFDGTGTTSSIIKAIQYAENNGAKICNLSLGTSNDDKALYYAMKNSNMLFVVAAGNDGVNTDIRPCYPASYDLENIISVASVNYDGSLGYSSNYGVSTVDIAAPGCYVLSTTCDNTYSYMTGTSMAAPFVSAVCAMVYSNYDDISLSKTKEIVLSSAKKLEGLNGVIKTGGILDAGSALNADAEAIDNTEWEVKIPEKYMGKAPVIYVSLSFINEANYITVYIEDEDNDIVKTLYAEGEVSADYFEKGNNGEPFELTGGKKTFSATPGAYTFYAIDSCNNEIAYTVTVKERQNLIKNPKNENDNRNPFDWFFRDRRSTYGGGFNNLFDYITNLFNMFF